MPVTSPQGTLDFKKVDKITFVGASSNTVIDTTTGSVGIGVVGDALSSNLHVVGDTRMEGNINMLHTSNTASIKLNSNVVTEFPRSKKLIKYPRVALTQNDESATSGYIVGRSSIYDPHEAWYMFDEDSTTFWHSGNSTGYWNSDGTYDGSSELVMGHPGEYVTLQLPTNEKAQLHGIRVFPRGLRGQNPAAWSAGAAPKDVVVVGSNNGSSWNVIASTTLTNYSFGTSPSMTTPVGEEYVPATFDFEGTEYYQHVGLIIKSIYTGGHVHASMTALEFLGLPEYDPEAYGTDVTIKSKANVPNTDFLDVFIDAGNTSGYSLSGSSVTSVTDLSSPANTMSVTGVTYDSTNKAFVFSGSSSSYIKATLVNGNGNYAHTLSAWFMMTDYSNSWRTIIGLGTNTPSGQQSAIAYDPDQDQLYFGTYGADIYVPHKPELGRWYHVAATFSGGETSSTSMNIYLNGVNMGGAPDGTQTPSFTGNQLSIGGAMNTNGVSVNNPFKGQIANARFYRRAYTSDEIYQLYAYQKEYFGNGDLSMSLKAGRLGIGTSEPRAMLDVRGFIKNESAWFYAYDGDAMGGTENNNAGTFNDYTGFVPFNKLKPGSKYFTTSNTTSGGYFTAPCDGIYHFNTSVLNYPNARSGITEIFFSVNDDTNVNNSYGYIRKTNMPSQHCIMTGSTFRLSEGDSVKVYVINIDLYTDSYIGIFSGYLVTML